VARGRGFTLPQGIKVPVSRQLRNILVCILFFLVALSLISAKLHAQQGLSFVEAMMVELTAPVEKGVRLVVNTVGDVWRGYFRLVRVQRENQQLKEEIQELRRELNLYREAARANQRLRDLLNFRESAASMPLLPAEVVAFDPSGWFKTVLIDKGQRDGLGRDMAVVSAAGVVGRLIGVTSHYAKVLLILDRNSSVDALIQRSRSRGILVGLGDGRCSLRYVQRNDDVKVGDQVITSGMGGVFPKGILLGQVERVQRGDAGLFQTVDVTPVVDFSRLEEVLVVLTSVPDYPEEQKIGRAGRS
jgi:rod shape-determining protein MreC